MPCKICGKPIKPEEPDIRYRPGDGETRMDYHSWCWLEDIVYVSEIEPLIEDMREEAKIQQNKDLPEYQAYAEGLDRAANIIEVDLINTNE